MVDLVGQQLGNYRLLRPLGRGGFADVYLGEHIHLTTLAAIKVLQTRLGADDSDAFLAEARTIAHLEHPHIVRVLDYGIFNGTPFLVMNYAPNGTLRQRHSRGKRVPLQDVIAYVQQVADALTYAHSQKLIHRDIKPENMLLDRQYRVLLSDFGIALLNQSSRHNSTHDVVGTMAYMAPEQLQGKTVFASDQYALAVVTYEWLCGYRPFEGSLPELFSQHLTVLPIPLSQKVPGLSPNIDEVVLRALAKDPQARFPSVAAFAAALTQAIKPVLRAAAVPAPQHHLNPPPPQPTPPVPSASASNPASPSQNQPPGASQAMKTPPPPSGRHPALPGGGQGVGTSSSSLSGSQPATSSSAPHPSFSTQQHVAFPHATHGKRQGSRKLWFVLLACLLILSGIVVYAINNGGLPQGHSPTQTQTSSASPSPSPSATPTPLPAPGQVLYQADWSKDMAGWQGSSDWKWIDTGILGTDGGGSRAILLAPYTPPSSTYAVEASMQFLQGQFFGLLARTTDKFHGNTCDFTVQQKKIKTVQILGVTSKDLSALNIDPTQAHTYRMEVKANSITCFIDGKRVIQGNDNSYLDAGQVGMYSYNTQIEAFSFKVIAL